MDNNDAEFDAIIMFEQIRKVSEATYLKNPLDADNLTRWAGALLELAQFHNEDPKLTVQEQMNHLQQHSNQVSMDLYNHVTGTLPQLPVSTSAFNQSHSLAPLPNSLTIHQNPNMESYSRLLGVQETGMNELLSMNMLPYNNINTNNVDVITVEMTYNTIIHMYGKQGQLDLGLKLYKVAREKFNN
ncbi:hypothetical protein F2Q69_00024524 [Brassica cretica]|uniref:Uncharacterized protein n=1 Tax=Brassica cretica TaxID=69181 RepID=A0A8S9QHG8_BRACR|nr:hypothetical protein F2Q69_00024524 [Brassica cretica]